MDFSNNAQVALTYAVDILQGSGGSAHVAHVIEPDMYPSYWGLAQTGYPELVTELREYAEKKLNALQLELQKKGIETHTAILSGKAHEEIITYALDNAIDMICISTHGRSGFGHFMLGSTTELVLRNAPCPTLAIRSPISSDDNDAQA